MNAGAAPVIVFDGVCVLCSRWVDFILRHDRAGRFRLAAMQGEHCRLPEPGDAWRFLD